MRSLSSYLNRTTHSIVLGCLIVLASHGSAFAQNGTWTDADGDGAWGDIANWSNGTGPIASGSGNTADFSAVDLVPTTVNTNYPGFYRNSIQQNDGATRTIGNMIFGDADPVNTPGGWELYVNPGTEATNTITLAGTTPTITVNQMGPLDTATLGDATPEFIDDAIIRARLVGTSGFTKAGTGILTLTGVNTGLTGPINVNTGTLRLGTGFTYTGSATTTATVANGAVLETRVDGLRNVKIAAGATTATVRAIVPGATIGLGANAANAGITGFGTGETLNLELGANPGFFYDARSDWGSTAATAFTNLNVTGINAGQGNLRLHINGGQFVGTSFQNTNVNLNNASLTTRTNSGGSTVTLGSLTGNASSTLNGGAAGTVAIYNIGNIPTANTTFAGSITTGAGILINKVQAGTLTLSGNLTYTTTNNANINLRGGVTRITAGTLALTGTAAIPGGINDVTLGDLFTTIDVRSGAFFDVTGTSSIYSTVARQQLIGAGTVKGNFNHAAGTLKPADVPAAATPNGNVTTATAGTLPFENNLTLSGTSEIRFDMTNNPASGNDLITVGGVTTLTAGKVTPNFLTAPPTAGTYTILTSTGGFSGAPSNITIDWPGRLPDPVPFISGNNLQFTATDTSAVADLIWIGDQANPNIWDVQTTQNWLNGANHDSFFQLDKVNFDDTASTYSVTLNTSAQISAMTVNNSTNAYSITGTGAITGSGGLTKTGTNTLTIGLTGMTSINTFTGPASISGGGTINTGTTVSGLGTGVLNMSGGKVIAALGGSIANSSIAVGAGTNVIEINGNNATAFAIPAMTGSGTAITVTTTAPNTLVDLSNISGFNGTLTISPDGVLSTAMNARFNGAGTGNANAAIVLANGAQIRDRNTGVQTIPLGSLTGDSTSSVGGFQGGATATVKTWQIGGLNTSTTFAGTITNGAGRSGGVDTVAAVALTKVGTGTLTLTGNNNYGGLTTVNAGTLLVNGTHVQDTSPTTLPTTGLPPFNPGDYVVNSGGTLGGTGTIGDGLDPLLITVNSGGTLAPGASIGTLSAISDVAFSAGSTFKVEVNGTSNTSDLLAITGNLTLGGASLAASLLAGTVPTGPHTIATYSGTLTGTFAVPSGIVVDYGTGSNSQITMTINSLGVPGDFNSDGKVDAGDYITWRKNNGTSNALANDNNLGVPIGQDHYNLWRANFGNPPGSGSGSGAGPAAVPEPAAWVLAIIFISLASWPRFGRR